MVRKLSTGGTPEPVSHADAAPVVVPPSTPVYATNRAAIDRFLQIAPSQVESTTAPPLANRFAPLLKHLDRIFEASPIRKKRRRVLVEERWFNRTYTTPAYVFGRETGRRPDRPALILTAGIHGDEMGAVLGMTHVLERIAQDPSLLERFEPIVIVPCVHPASLDLGIRELVDGRDPNRLFYTDDPTRPASVRALEALALERTELQDVLLIDAHQDDRYAEDASYALYANERSRAIAGAALEGTTSQRVTDSIDDVANEDGLLPKRYAGSFAIPPEAAKRTLPPAEIILELNDATQFWPAVEAAMQRFGATRGDDR